VRAQRTEGHRRPLVAPQPRTGGVRLVPAYQGVKQRSHPLVSSHVAKRSSAEKTEGTWEIRHGRVRAKPRANTLRRGEDLQYNNPYRYKIERVWFDGRVVLARGRGQRGHSVFT